MKKGGLADSPFFAQPVSEASSPTPPRAKQVPTEELTTPEVSSHRETRSTISDNPKGGNSVIPRHHDTTVPRRHDTTVSRHHDTMVETVRKAVKEFGKEAATHRFTAAEKKAVMDIIYSYQGLGIKTSENEIARIALNFILDDYKQNGRNSILDKVLRALNE